MIKRGLKPLLAEVGKIKIGYKGKEIKSSKGNMFRPPKKLDYFVITTTERDANKDLIADRYIMDRIKQATGQDQLRELRIRLPFDSIDKNFFTEYQYYAGRKRICSGDGVEATRKFAQAGKQVLPFEDGDKEMNVKAGQEVKIKCDPESCPFYQASKCKMSGILSVFLPDAQDLGGVYKFRTHSYNSVSSILAALEYFSAQTKGVLQGMPLKMVMVKKTTEEHGNIDYVTVVIDGLEIQGLRKAAIEELSNRKLLGSDIQAYENKMEQAGFFQDTDPEDVIQDEYYPETVEIEPEPENAKGITSDQVAEKLVNKPEIEKAPAKQEEELF